MTATGGVLYFRRIGRIINYIWLGNATAVADNTNIGTLDELYRPLADICFVIRNDLTTYKGSYIGITAAGVVTVNGGGGARGRGSVCTIALTY